MIDPARRDAREALTAALTDPHRLVDELLASSDDADARRRLGAAFGLTESQAQVVVDAQFRLLTGARRAELAEEVRVERTPLGAPLHLRAALDASGRVATAAVDTGDLQGRGPTAAKALEALAMRVVEEVARPQHRPVVMEVEGLTGLERLVVRPNRSITYDWREDATPEAP